MSSSAPSATASGRVVRSGNVAGSAPGRGAPSWIRSRSMRSLITRLLCMAVLLAAWEALVVAGVLSTDAVAKPTDILRVLGALVGTGAFWSSIGDTLRSWAIGLAISLLIALPAGLLFGASSIAYRMSRFTIDFLRTIPPVALLPLALLLYGATEQMALLLIVVGSVWPVVLMTMYGVHQVDPVTRDVARAYRLGRRDRIFSVILPSAAPFIATGVRIAATMSLLLAIGAELLGGAPGIGNSIAVAQQTPDIPTMYAFVVVAALLGVGLNLAMVNIEGRVLAWHPSHRSRKEP